MVYTEGIMRNILEEGTTVKEVIDNMAKKEQISTTYFLNNAKLRIRVFPKKQK